jgi:hypothetical protein
MMDKSCQNSKKQTKNKKQGPCVEQRWSFILYVSVVGCVILKCAVFILKWLFTRLPLKYKQFPQPQEMRDEQQVNSSFCFGLVSNELGLNGKLFLIQQQACIWKLSVCGETPLHSFC